MSGGMMYSVEVHACVLMCSVCTHTPTCACSSYHRLLLALNSCVAESGHELPCFLPPASCLQLPGADFTGLQSHLQLLSVDNFPTFGPVFLEAFFVSL